MTVLSYSSTTNGSSKLNRIDGYYPMDQIFDNHKMDNARAPSKFNTQERSKFSKLCGRLLIVLTLTSFIFIGAILNCLQVIFCLTARLSDDRGWQRWHKHANGYLVYLIFSQPIFLIYFWTRVDLKIHLDDKTMIEDVKKRVIGIMIANHTYELDWLVCFLLADQVGNIGSYKAFAKSELKWLPVIGWSFWLSDLVYVQRDWPKDKLNIEKKLNQLLSYDQILLGIFAEGTRLTKEKFAEAREFAVTKGMEPYKYHLFPRARGFNYTLRHYLRAANVDKTLDEKQLRVFNLEFVLPDKPNFKHFVNGSYIKADIYCEEVLIGEDIRKEAIESDSAENCPKLTELLQNIYRRKDELIENYKTENGFHTPSKMSPNGGLFPLKKPIGVLFWWTLFMSTTYGTLIYLAFTVFAQSLGFWTLVTMFLASGMWMLQQIEKESKPNNLRMLKKRPDKDCDFKAA